ncbi:MAG: GNAT family N-acetyltransferase [Wenzhouxiangellaceae bacterium]
MPSAISTSSDLRPFSAIPADDWNALNRGANPFSDHRFMLALERSGALRSALEWPGGALVCDQGYAPLWHKDHSHGEFVFDHLWAEAAERAGIRWYPKTLVAIPLTPVTGPRLLARNAADRRQLVRIIEGHTETRGHVSASVNFCDAQDAEVLREAGWLERLDVQFHWTNRGWTYFDEFLGSLKRKVRRNIARERRLAREQGWRCRWVHGTELGDAELDLAAQCYRNTFVAHHNLPSLNRAFFAQCARSFGDDLLLCIARREGVDRAVSIFWRSPTRLYGRYWGATEATRHIHFEVCYYQAIEYCIRHGLEAFEPGAQGLHKLKRGCMPVTTRSFHHIRHSALREGIRVWLEHERRAVEAFRSELTPHLPYRELEIH